MQHLATPPAQSNAAPAKRHPWKQWGFGGAAILALYAIGHDEGSLLTGLSVLSLGAFWAWSQLQKSQFQAPSSSRPKAITHGFLAQKLDATQSQLNQLKTEATDLQLLVEMNPTLVKLQHSLSQIKESIDRKTIRIAITGNLGAGKTSILQQIQTQWLPQQDFKCEITELQNIDMLQVDLRSITDEASPLKDVLKADLILWVIQGDLLQSEREQIQQLRQHQNPVMLLVNKCDQFMPVQLDQLSETLNQALDNILEPADIIMLAAQPQPIKVRQHSEDGAMQEREETPAPQLVPLWERFQDRLTEESRQQLIWQQVLSEIERLNIDIGHHLNVLRRQKAQPLLEKYQWLNASAAFASPLPSTDMIAAAAITGKMVVDLGAIYHHRFSLKEAQNIATILAAALVKLGVVELSTQLMGAVLKGHITTYVAGGVIQGLSSAYLTRIAGLSLVEHFEIMSCQPSDSSASIFSAQHLNQVVERVLQNNQRIDLLKGFVKTGIGRLQPAQ